ncbi:MAG: hypothetical protein CL599_19280 [Alteromonas sp.]|nr:hypothetical protein [Alteromonas sp.]|tara:strand:- start:34079 stop:34321 length:243 start_codon:yes stop_codon:yes gene_type:complete
MTIKLSNGVELIGKMQNCYLMAEYDYHMIHDKEDYLLFVSGLYSRAGMQMSTYPKELFYNEDKSSSKGTATEQEKDTSST